MDAEKRGQLCYGGAMRLLAATVLLASIALAGAARAQVPRAAARCFFEDLPSSQARVEVCGAALAAHVLAPPLLALAYSQRGEAYCEEGQYDLALADDAAAIKLEPDFPDAWHQQGCAYAGKQNLGAAIASFSEAIRLAPDFAEAYVRRGVMYQAARRREPALADFTKAISLDPANLEAVNARAKFLFNEGKFHEAAAALVDVVALAPEDYYPVLWLHIARVRAHEDDAAEFAANMATLDLSGQWPTPIFDLYQGKLSLDEFRIVRPGWRDPQKVYCDTVLFGGEYALMQGAPETARVMIEGASFTCSQYPNQTLTARAELRNVEPQGSPYLRSAW